MPLPNPGERPAEELSRLVAAWRLPPGFGLLSEVNNSVVGLLYIGAAFLFFLLAGLLALLMRTQLALPENHLLDAQQYNRLFTMHGTMMMFLFAVPAVEAMGVLLLPNMLGARDLPFPRLSAYAVWAYVVGGLLFFGSLFFGLAPDGGWFMYPPLTSYPYSPGDNSDFWLLGIGFIEISAIAGAVELVVGILRTRAPGMTLDRMPIFAWAMLVTAGMIIFAFPAVILGTALLELERAFHWPFFLPDQGGNPLLWQHLFWFFGHPDVYIIFLPAAGMVSMIVAAMARTPLVGYRYVVFAMVATGVISFALWVHHMFNTGIPHLSLGFFTAASLAVSIPSGIQVFAWIATLAAGRLQWKAPALFVLGFLFTFVLGGLTGVMVAVVPFDWQFHDTYFVVAHLHYVLFGGLVFPLFAAFYYWAPYVSRTALSERLGRWVFALLFAGFQIAFFPMHLTGLLGMPRRVYTFPPGLGWDWLNLLSTLGAFLIAAGVVIFLVDLVRHFRPAVGPNAGNVWKAGTLEWLPNALYSMRSIPAVTSREPIWDQPGLAAEVEAGYHYLPGAPTGGRETLITSTLQARPQYLLRMPGPGWSPLLAAVGTAGFFLLLTVKLVVPALAAGLFALAMVLVWIWSNDRGESHRPVEIGGGITLPVYLAGPASHSRLAMVVLLLVAASLFGALVFSYFFLWTVSPGLWPAPGALPDGRYPLLAAALLGASSLLMGYGSRGVGSGGGQGRIRLALSLAIPLLAAALGAEGYGQWQAGLRPTADSYGATIYTFLLIQGFFVAVALLMALYTLARSFAGLLDAVRRVTFDNTLLFWHYTVAQGVAALALLHLAPRWLGG